MTPSKPGAPPHTDDLDDAVLSIDDAASAESDWLLARERDPDAPPPSSEIASDYAEIDDLLGNLPMPTIDERWHDDVLRAAATTRPPRPWWRTGVFRWSSGVGAVVAAAAVSLFVIMPRTPPELEVATRPGPAMRGDAGEVKPGDTLVVSARPRGAADLRVYRSDGRLVARCPDGPHCRTGSQGELTIEALLDAPLQYQVILTSGMAAALPIGAVDEFLYAANAAGADITDRSIDVH